MKIEAAAKRISAFGSLMRAGVNFFPHLSSWRCDPATGMRINPSVWRWGSHFTYAMENRRRAWQNHAMLCSVPTYAAQNVFGDPVEPTAGVAERQCNWDRQWRNRLASNRRWERQS